MRVPIQVLVAVVLDPQKETMSRAVTVAVGTYFETRTATDTKGASSQLVGSVNVREIDGACGQLAATESAK